MQLVSKWILLGSLVTAASACKSDPPAPQAKTDNAKAKPVATASASASAAAAPPPVYTLDDVPGDIRRCSESWLGNVFDVGKQCAKVHELWSAGGVEAAVPKYKAACDGGDGKSCMLLIGALAHPKSSMQSKNIAIFAEDAAALIIKACELKQYHACYHLGDHYTCGTEDGAFEPSTLVCPSRMKQYMKGKTPADFVALLQPACDKGIAAACTKAGSQLTKVKGEVDEVAELWKKGCMLGDSLGCVEAIRWAQKLGKSDEERALRQAQFKITERDCRESDDCTMLMSHYADGATPAEHLPKVRELITASCAKKKLGDVDCVYLVDMQIKGAGGPSDIASALPRLNAICEDPFAVEKSFFVVDMVARSCRELARMYHEGKNVEKDDAKAKQLLKTICNKPGTTASMDVRAACRELEELKK